MWIRHSLLVLAFVFIGCKTKEDAAAVPMPNAQSTKPEMSADQVYSLNLPARWAGVTRTDSLSTAERGGALPGAVNIVYIPRDTAIIPQTLVVIAAYDSTAWARVKAESGPPPGDSIASGNGKVYTVGMPQSNPFTPGSVDALKFDSLSLTPDEKGAIVRIPVKN